MLGCELEHRCASHRTRYSNGGGGRNLQELSSSNRPTQTDTQVHGLRVVDAEGIRASHPSETYVIGLHTHVTLSMLRETIDQESKEAYTRYR